MNNTHYSPHRNQYAHVGVGRPMPTASRYLPPAPQPSARGGYGPGFCDGFCDGVGKVLEVAVKALPFTTFFR